MIRMFVPFLAIAVLATMNPSVAGAAQRKAGPRAGAKPAVTSAVNINSASASQLEALPGIGAKTAARIIDYRQKNGPFKKIEDILERSRSCPYLLSISRLSAHQSVARNR